MSSLVKYKQLIIKTTVKIFLNLDDLEEGRKIDVLKYDKKNRNTHNGQIFALAISAGDRYLATGGADMIIRVWNFLNFQHVKNLLGHKNFITGNFFSNCFGMQFPQKILQSKFRACFSKGHSTTIQLFEGQKCESLGFRSNGICGYDVWSCRCYFGY